MTWLIKVTPTERLLIESGINNFQVVGPGLIWLFPWQRPRARLYIGPNIGTVDCLETRVMDDLPLDVTIKVIYRVNPELLGDELLPRIPALNEGGWHSLVQWRTEAMVRRLLARYDWRVLKDPSIQEDVERQLNAVLAERLKAVGLEVIAVTLVRIQLDGSMQRTIIRSEQDGIEASGRARVLKNYFDIFGDSLSQAMPYIVQWELLNTLHKKGNPQLLLGASSLSLGATSAPNGGLAPSPYQLSLPIVQESAGGLDRQG